MKKMLSLLFGVFILLLMITLSQSVKRSGCFTNSYLQVAYAGECSGDEDCPAGYRCVNGTCNPSIPSEIRPVFTTERPTPRSCERNVDCYTDELCVGEQCLECHAYKGCPNGQSCVGSMCTLESMCFADEDCPEETWCREDGLCVECFADEDCPEGIWCNLLNGQCQPRCKEHADCEAFTWCNPVNWLCEQCENYGDCPPAIVP